MGCNPRDVEILFFAEGTRTAVWCGMKGIKKGVCVYQAQTPLSFLEERLQLPSPMLLHKSKNLGSYFHV